MAYHWGRAFNPLTREWMEQPKRPSMFDYSHVSEWLPAHYQYISDMKKWEAFIKELPATYVYKRPKLVHATEKGIPVSGLRDGKRRKYVNGAGVSANSRILPHRYADRLRRSRRCENRAGFDPPRPTRLALGPLVA